MAHENDQNLIDNPDDKPTRPEPGRDAPVDDVAAMSEDDLRENLRRSREATKKANKEAADRRRRLEELETADREREAAKLSETDKQKRAAEEAARKAREAEERAARAEARLIQVEIDREVERVAAALKPAPFRYPSTVPKLIDPSRVGWDAEAGKATGVKDAVERLAKEYPDLLEAKSQGGTPPRPSNQPNRPNPGNNAPLAPRDELIQTGRYNV